MSNKGPLFKITELNDLIRDFRADPAGFAARYTSVGPWATDEALYMEEEGYGTPANLQDALMAAGDEAQRCEVMHSLLRLTRRAASNPLLWSRVAHVDLWGYMRSRWPIEPLLADLAAAEPEERKDVERTIKRFVETRYFVRSASSRLLVKHAAARLWWFGRMALREDGVYRNAWVLVYIKDIVERSYGRNPTVVRAVIDFIAAHNGQIKGDISKSHWRVILKELNRIGGNSLVPAMSTADVWAFMAEAFEIICSARDDRFRAVGLEEAAEMTRLNLIPRDIPARWDEDLEPVDQGITRPEGMRGGPARSASEREEDHPRHKGIQRGDGGGPGTP